MLRENGFPTQPGAKREPGARGYIGIYRGYIKVIGIYRDNGKENGS